MITEDISLKSFFAALLTPIVQSAVQAEFDRRPFPSASNQSTPRSNRIGGTELVKELTGYSDSTIYNKVSKNEIPVHSREGGKLLFSEEQLREWISQGRPKNQELTQSVDSFLGSRKRRTAA
ncbi:helix-turn-helix transcriptional regulator [Larkinella terrae]|uniref:Helix-turn-helix domain-containing protein n=1 Tax=Larkinella terrae TaxID=2025311 RepID=A0A7K0EJH8_9BACT|nr:helix-turn-helix domain-containing protein [Larkinella terrae]MRS61681.1 helix-turn-helix domain-containing protein [Larkinella terrae]